MKILCVTKCPTGMVQTYVAAEKLEQAGKKLGVDLSVETQGAMGIQNQFSPEQILESLTTKSYSYQDATVSNKKILG